MHHIQTLLLQDRSKEHMLYIVDYIGTDQRLLKELVSSVMSEDSQLAFRAAWTLGHVADQRQNDLSPFLGDLLDEFFEPRHPTIERCLLKVLEAVDQLPEDRFTEIVDHLFGLITDNSAMIAARAFSMTVLLKHLKPYPELLLELKESILSCMDYGTAAYTSRGRRTLKALKKLGI